MGKTGGGPGTNQYKIRGQSRARQPSYNDRVSPLQTPQQCAWPPSGPDGPWCLRHGQLPQQLRPQDGPCVTKLPASLQCHIVQQCPVGQLGPWVHQLDVRAQRLVARRLVEAHGTHVRLAGGPQSASWPRVALADGPHAMAMCLDVGGMSKAAQEVLDTLKQIATGVASGVVTHDIIIKRADHHPPESSWAQKARSSDAHVRKLAAQHMPHDQLGWAKLDPDWRVRQVAAQRMPLGQLGWARTDPNPRVRRAAARRNPDGWEGHGVRESDPQVRKAS